MELRELLAYVGRHPNDDQLEEIIEQVDVDHNGRIDFNEFRKVMDRFTADESADQELREAFRIFDKVGIAISCVAVSLPPICITHAAPLTSWQFCVGWQWLLDTKRDDDGNE